MPTARLPIDAAHRAATSDAHAIGAVTGLADALAAKAALAPIVSYEFTGNREVRPTAISTVDGTITAAGHGLANGDIVYVTRDLTAVGKTTDILPTGLGIRPQPNGYYVVEATADSFKLALTSGGAAIVPTTAGDVSKSNVQKITLNPTISIENLPDLQCCRVVLTGRAGVSGAQVYIIVRDETGTAIGVSLNNFNDGAGYGMTFALTENFTVSEFLISTRGNPLVTCDRTVIDDNTGALTTARTAVVRAAYRNRYIRTLVFSNMFPLNGVTIEVYPG